MRRKRAVCGGADHRGGGTKSKVSDPDFVQKFLSHCHTLFCAMVDHQIWYYLVTKPRHLALRVLACVIDGDSACIVEADLPAEVAKQLRSTVRLQPRPTRVGLTVEHLARLLEHTGRQHGVEARRDAGA